jgi:asparagine synthase (glutamine-hydrolysing)
LNHYEVAMCGIWATVGHLANDPLDIASRALELVSHRGPDGYAVRVFETAAAPVVLAHRRLAIIDTTHDARQPMSSANGAFTVSFNGSIFNHEELGRSLEGRGIRMRTRSDTEVLVEGLTSYGLDLLEQLRGLFAFVAYDAQTQQVIAARDRFGIKPLYYWQTSTGIAFASEIKQFAALPGFRRHLNDDALIDYLAFGLFDHGDQTFCEGVRQVEPGHALVVSFPSAYGRAPEVEMRCWVGRSGTAASHANEHALPDLRSKLDRAVKYGMRADVRMGAALSGGLDSSTITAIAASDRPVTERLDTVGIFFDAPGIDEMPYANAVADHVGAHLTAGTVDADELGELFASAVWHFDEPVARPNMLAQFKLYRLFRERGIKVVLSGQGGDELFGGYEYLWPALIIEQLQRGQLACSLGSWRAARAQGVESGRLRRGIWSELLPSVLLERWMRSGMCRDSGFDAAMLNSVDVNVARMRLCTSRTRAPIHYTRGRAANASERLIRFSNLPMLLHYDDRASMAAQIESRPVMLDHDLVNTALALPVRMRASGGRLKGALRDAMAGSLPCSVIGRTNKLGFPVPEAAWLASTFGKTLSAKATDALAIFPHVLSRVLDVDSIRERLAAGRLDGVPVWALASLAQWHESS